MNKLKVNFYRFTNATNDVDLNINVIEAKNETDKIKKHLEEIKMEADAANNVSSKILSSLTSVKSGSNLKQMRKNLETNIKDSIKNIQEYIQSGNASDKFVVRVKPLVDKFEAYENVTDHRRKPKETEITKLSSVQKGLGSAAISEETNKVREVTKVQRELNNATKEELKIREQVQKELDEQEQKQKSLEISVSQGIGMVATGVNSIHNKFSSIVKHITGVAVTFRILGGVVSGITNTFKNLYDTAASYQEAVNLYRTAMGNYAEEADKWAERISTALHLDPKDIMQYTGALYNLVQGLGVGADAAYTMATNLTQLSYDMSSYLNIDVESAYTKIQSAITGQARAVAKAGVAMQIASLQELAYSIGIKKSVSEMTQAEKTYLRYIQLMRSTSNMQQDLGKTILTPENALRVLKAEFIQFARALGQVVIPIVLKTIPYLVALANILKSVADKIAKFLGFEMTKIDYDSFSTGNEKLKALNDSLDETGASAKSARDEIQRTLAPFDELNVVENESKNNGSGIGGAGGSVIPQLEEYITGYDMLGKLTKDFDKSVEEARKNLEKVLPTIKNIAIAFAAWKLIEKIASFTDLISKFKTGIKEGKGFGGVIKKLGDRFSYGYSEATKLGTTGLGAIKSGISSMLGTIGTVIATVGLMVGSFTGAFTIMKNWNGETDNLIGRLVGAGGLVAALTVTAGVFLGPWAAAGVVVAGLVGGIVGLEQALAKERLEAEKQAGFPELFQNQGIAISGAYDLVEKGVEDVVKHAGSLQELVDANDKVEKSWEESKEAFEQYQTQLSNGEITYSNHKDMVDGVTTAVDNLKKAGEDRIVKEKENELKALEILKEETNMTESEYEKRKKKITEFYDAQTLMNNGYYDQYKKLLIQREEGAISEEKFQEEIKKLQKEYLGLNTVTELATEKAQHYLEAQNGKIDLKSPEEFNNIIKTATDRRKEYIDQENNSHQKLIDDWKAQRDAQQKIIDTIEEQYGEYKKLEGAQREQYDNASNRIKLLNEDIATAEEAQRLGAEKINATYKNFLLGLLMQLAATGADQSETFKGSIADINKELETIGQDVDPTKSAVDFMSKYAETMTKEGRTFSATQNKQFKTYGIDLANMFGEGIISEFAKSSEEYQNKISGMLNGNVKKLLPQSKNNGREVGGAFSEGYGNGILDNSNKVSENTGKLGSIYSVDRLRTELDSHSPSQVTTSIGRDFSQGFANGIQDEAPKAENAVKELATRASRALQSTTMTLNIDTSIEKSLNSILSKIQTFCNNWRKSINSLISSTGTAINSIKISNGKLSFSAIPNIYVPKFAEGGFPNSGDLFFANENGVPEYITSIGNRSAVANQDQMVSALSGAIITAMSKIPTNTQPSNITVYVGDKKLYEGQGEYQNRQNDRYGTTVVRI